MQGKKTGLEECKVPAVWWQSLQTRQHEMVQTPGSCLAVVEEEEESRAMFLARQATILGRFTRVSSVRGLLGRLLELQDLLGSQNRGHGERSVALAVQVAL